MEIVHIDTKYRYGFHIRTRSSLEDTISAAAEMNINAMQIYLGNSRGYALAKADPADILSAKKILEEREIYICAHAPLIYNPAGKTDLKAKDLDSVRDKVISGMVAQLDIMAALGGGVVLHIGSCKDKKEGIKSIAKTLCLSLSRDGSQTETFSSSLSLSVDEFKKKRLIILENAAGEGTKIGVTLEEIASIFREMGKTKQVKVCIDTAHIFGAGQYDFGVSSQLKKFYKDFDELIGINKLELFHLNDSRRSENKTRNAYFGSKKDRHEYLGRGYIFDEEDKSRWKALQKFFLLARKNRIPIIGEPPDKIEIDGKLINGPGGYREREYVCHLLKNTQYPLEY